MSAGKWKASEELLRMFQVVGRASLAYDIQDSHSGNMAVRWTDEGGEDVIVITATGSQKGDLDRSQICFLSPSETDYGYYKASSETDVHARILSLPGVRASMHAHVKELVIATLDDGPKPAEVPPFVPVDPLGFHHLGGLVPIDWFAVPSGSPEMARTIPERLADHVLTLVWGHGAMTKGRTLKEAFFRLCVANNAGAVVRQMGVLGVDIEGLRRKILADPNAQFAYQPPEYEVEGDDRCDFPEEEEILKEFVKTGHRIFESRLSPFHTGSMSVRGVDAMLYAPKASMPREIGGPLLKIPLAPTASDNPEAAVHKAIYAASDFQTVLHCYVPSQKAHEDRLGLVGQRMAGGDLRRSHSPGGLLQEPVTKRPCGFFEIKPPTTGIEPDISRVRDKGQFVFPGDRLRMRFVDIRRRPKFVVEVGQTDLDGDLIAES